MAQSYSKPRSRQVLYRDQVPVIMDDTLIGRSQNSSHYYALSNVVKNAKILLLKIEPAPNSLYEEKEVK